MNQKPIAWLLKSWMFLLTIILWGCSQETRNLSGQEAKMLFSNQTVSGYHEKHGYSFVSYYDPSGTFRSYQNGSKTPKIGKWWVTDAQICIRWEIEGKDLCRNMVTDQKQQYWKYLIKSNGARIKLVTFHSFETGNPKNL